MKDEFILRPKFAFRAICKGLHGIIGSQRGTCYLPRFAEDDFALDMIVTAMENSALDIMQRHPSIITGNHDHIMASFSRRLVSALPFRVPGHSTFKPKIWRRFLRVMNADDIALWASRGLGLQSHQAVVFGCLEEGRTWNPDQADENATALAQCIGAHECDRRFFASPAFLNLRGVTVAPYLRAQVAAFPDLFAEGLLLSAIMERSGSFSDEMMQSILMVQMAGLPARYFQPVFAQSTISKALFSEATSNHGRLALYAQLGTLEEFICDPVVLTAQLRQRYCSEKGE
ncbi:hypothetical protein ACOI1H_22765 [Loktanella sp. DJP18]|uniref:hypothetical protein n=1 Tax=Loktanella sp. DJP18 TaxID=3409788 RepID=UPI003BB48DEB